MTISSKTTSYIIMMFALLFSSVQLAGAATAQETNLVALQAKDIPLEANGGSTTFRFSTLSGNE